MAKSLNTLAGEAVQQLAAKWEGPPDVAQMYELMRMLGRWRSHLLVRLYVEREGARIFQGPFAGMEYLDKATEGALIPRLLGTYESELHPHLAAFAAEGPDCVIDVGCAEGYYAIGLARLMPQTTVYAFDIDERARVACADLAARNGVAERVIVGGEFKPADFEAFAGRRALVMVDAEGAEDDILRPDLAPALAGMNIIVETHDVYRAGVRDRMIERFTPTHEIVEVEQQPKTFTPPTWFNKLSHLDQLLAVWEWRLGPTPWLVMRPKA
jgi:SAM-dependent methyltransferase